MFQQPIVVKNLDLPNRLMLAPLAGVSDVPFRRICYELGAGLCYVEMLASNAVLHRNVKTRKAMTRHPDEPRLGVQVTGPDAEEIARAIEVLDREGFDTIDINMGCPVKKVVSKGWGSGLLSRPEQVREIVAAARSATERPLSIKIRLGMDRNRLVMDEVADHAGAEGCDLLTVHGRTREDNYGVPVDYTAIRSALESGKRAAIGPLVTVGNGDILDPAAAGRMQTETGCDAIMISRGALGNPWIFRDLLAESPPPTPPQEWLDGVLRHMDYHRTYYGDHPHTAALFRKHLLWYATGFPGTRKLREELSTADDLNRVGKRLRQFATELPAGCVRYEHPESNAATGQSGEEPKYQMNRKLDRSAAEDGYRSC